MNAARRQVGWVLAGLLAGGLAATAWLRWDIAQRREAFQADARTAHRLLSQRTAGLEAVLGLLRLADPALRGNASARLQALYPEVRAVRIDPATPPDRPAAQPGGPGGAPRHGAGGVAEGVGGDLPRDAPAGGGSGVAVVAFDPAGRGFTLQAGATGSRITAEVDIDRWLQAAGWPVASPGPVAARLQWAERGLVLAEGGPARGVTPGFRFAKALGAPARPLELQLQRATGPADWPWAVLAALLAAGAAGGGLVAVWRQQREARLRAEALLRLDRLARLNTLGEMAAGLAHELNQPLTAVLASTQAARRLLADEPAPAPALREALEQAVAQTRRAADIVGRLRQRLGHGAGAGALQVIDLRAALRQALALLAPELQAAGIQVQAQAAAASAADRAATVPALVPTLVPAPVPALVRADPVALDQILHNLLRNALQALAGQPAARRRIDWAILPGAPGAGQVVLRLRDHGPGLDAAIAERLFQPFNTSRPEGLGLGLSLSETLAAEMGGALTAEALPAGEPGTAFRLALLAADAPATAALPAGTAPDRATPTAASLGRAARAGTGTSADQPPDARPQHDTRHR